MIYRGLAVTGTDTGVGKTTVACALAGLLREVGRRVGVLKPVETGCEGKELAPADGLALAAAAGIDFDEGPVSLADVVPWRFPDPLAPEEAARATGARISVDRIYQAMDRWTGRAELTLVETAGGLMVPINERFTFADLLLGLELPVLLVAANRLGVINHTLLTVEALERRGLKPIYVVLCRLDGDVDESVGSNARVIGSRVDARVVEVGHGGEDAVVAATKALRPLVEDLAKVLDEDWSERLSRKVIEK